MTLDLAQARAFLRPRRLAMILPAMVVASAPGAFWGQQAVDVPQLSGQPNTPMLGALLLPLPLACLVVAALHSDMNEMEQRAARNLRRLEVAQVAALLSIAGALLTLALAVNNQNHVILFALRGLILWTGVGLAAMPLIGRQVAWAAPMGLFVTMSLVTRDANGDVHVWAIPAYPIDSIGAWGISIAVCVIGIVLATSETNWLRGRFPRLSRTRPVTAARHPGAPGKVDLERL
ncbi:hypothetical protein LADH09A_000913 [Micromonospora sp. LAH09]|uniref:hypothetical protein n=1 Tax=Micromonospora cabrerizensis TaxID=2911213 RepID=UPI001EE9178A|nr:hypothetical protein [Micromonospora cabrerizensis]MCG5473029.1 hypothetical protein [Micromonospora cabrerizensis]